MVQNECVICNYNTLFCFLLISSYFISSLTLSYFPSYQGHRILSNFIFILKSSVAFRVVILILLYSS